MSRFKISWRMGQETVADAREFEEMLDLLQAGKTDSCADEMWIFISEPTSYGYEPLESIAAKCELYKQPAAQARARGIRVGINPWPTFGAGDSFRIETPPAEMPFPHMVGMDGTVAPRLACPVSEGFLAYTKERYKLFAKAGCDFVWVDDDCRFTHLGGVKYPCFCPDCIKNFMDEKFADRESLVAALNSPENSALREAWTAYGAQRLARYCAAVREAVDEVNPAIETPFMSVGYSHTTFAGDYIEQCMTALRAKSARPGHGFYIDESPLGMFEKVIDMSRQIVHMPLAVLDDVQYEEESCPCTPLNKSARTRLMELSLSIWGGCTGVAMNHLYNGSGPHAFDYLKKEAAYLSAARPFYDQYFTFAHSLPQKGIWGAFSEWCAGRMKVDEKGWFNEYDKEYDANRFVNEWPCFGTPVTCDDSAAWGTLLQGRTATVMTDAELTEIFKKPVILDGLALQALWERGWGEKTGVRIKSAYSGGSEKLAKSVYAPDFAGASRITVTADLAYNLEPIVEGVEVLAYTARPYGIADEVCATKYGNVVVLGYSPYKYTGTPGYQQLRANLQRAMGGYAWLEPQDAYLLPRVSTWVRGDENRAAVLLINNQTDTAENFRVVCRCKATQAILSVPCKPDTQLPLTRDGDFAGVEIPQLQPWDMAVIYLN